jgi:eukaryotic-like serine/threonine-protein kinase
VSSTVHDWAALSPLLDEALALEPADRRRWLDELASRQPSRAADIESLLDEQRVVESQGFLGDDLMHGLLAGSTSEVIGGYTLLEPLGEGGMGSVWLARRSDGRFDAEVAIKFLNPALLSGTGAARFRREGNLLARLTHPNIAHLFDAGISQLGRPYLVIEYVDGQRIDSYCDSKGLGVDARVRLFCDVLTAVAEAHRKLIVHRDIKPANVFVRSDGVVKLIDFGIAKLIGDADTEAEPLTRDGTNAFTPEYAAPEQIRGEAVTTVTDIYSLGALLFELLTGQRPFSSAQKASISQRTTELEAPLPSQRLSNGLGRRLEGDLDNIVAKALRFDPGDRYGSVTAFSDDLQRYLTNEPVSAHADTLTYRARKFVRRHRGSVATGLLTAVALVVATAITTLESIEAYRQRDEAMRQLRIAQATNDFVTALLSQTAQDGRGLTPVQLIDRGMDAIRLRYEDDPQFSISMLILLSGRYMDIGRNDKEYATLLEAESIARKTGNAAILLDVLCNTVETEVAAGQRVRAAARMDEARVLLAKTRGVEPVIEANCLREEAAVASRDHIAEAIDDLERARVILERNDLVYGNVYSSLFSWLSSFNHAAGRQRVAHRYHEQELALVAQHARGRTVAGAMTPIALADSWNTLGESRKSVDLFQRSLDQSDALNLHPTSAIYYGHALSVVGRHDEALQLIDRGIAHATRLGSDRYRLTGELERAMALARAGRGDESRAALVPMWAMLETADGDAQQYAMAFTCEAEILLADRRLDDAEAAATQALTRLGYPQNPLGSAPGVALTLRSRIRAAAGRPDDAIQDARAAAKMLDADVVDSTQSATVGGARLALAQAELANDDLDAARRDAARAAESLRNGLGANHPSTREAEHLLERLD